MQYSLNLGDIYAILTAICWSCGVICFDIAGRVLNSLQISLLKNIVGVLGFIIFLFIQSDSFPSFSQHEYFILIVSGVIGVAIGDLLFLASLRRIGSGLSAIISTSYSVSIFILAYIMYQEVISVFAYFGGVLVISGVIIGTMEKPENKTPKNIYIGVFCGILAHLFTAYSVLLLRPVMEFHPVVPIALVRFSTGIILFGLGAIPAIISIFIYACPPLIRLTDLGIRLVDKEIIEAAESFGASKKQKLWGVQIPLALPNIMQGINQCTMMALAMVVIASMIGTRGLGDEVLLGLQQLNVGAALEAGLAIVLLAIVLDRMTQAYGEKIQERTQPQKKKN